MTGFKSFANKTKLEFLPGMTAIVGPNGCGKSNISDALRWVLGEQSAKALRGSIMVDCIFNGTDARKPLGMAEVSVTFADCEAALGTEYDEVTITRRVFRSGEGQYFLNKTQCRLKDINRLFMDTGIGTTSYSLMEQGRIDRILSARPEDRRAVFEEASGITKFKADKKEAILKLDHTEANLIRLADVIREVKRHIGSLQRQAGKARRYKSLKNELRSLDVYSTMERLRDADKEIDRIDGKLSSFEEQLLDARAEIADMENGNTVLRESLVNTEREIGNVSETGVQARSTLEHTRELIETNKHRIDEYEVWSSRDSLEINKTRDQLEDITGVVAALTKEHETAGHNRQQAEDALLKRNSELEQHRENTESVRKQIQGLREDAVGLESLSSKLQNELVEIDTRERSSVIQRERLSAEKGQLTRVADSFEARQTEMASLFEDLRKNVGECESTLDELRVTKQERAAELDAARRVATDMQSSVAARNAQLDLLRGAQKSGEDFPGGTRILLDETDPTNIDRSHVLGALASHLNIEGDYEIALETALRSWLDAVVVDASTAAVELLDRIATCKAGATRLVSLDSPNKNRAVTSFPKGTKRLTDLVKCDDRVKPLLDRLMGNVAVVDTADAIPSSFPSDHAYVTKTGTMIHGNGCMEFWMSDASDSNPFSRKHSVEEISKSLETDQRELTDAKHETDRLTTDCASIEATIIAAQRTLDESRHAASQKEGESQIVANEATEARERLDTVSWELSQLKDRGDSGDSQRGKITHRVAEIIEQRERTTESIRTQTESLRELESQQSELQSAATDQRITFAALNQKAEHVASQIEASTIRAQELERAVQDRSAGVTSYSESIEKLVKESESANQRLSSLEAAVTTNSDKIESLKKNRDKQSEELHAMELALSQKRTTLEDVQGEKSALEIKHTECKMRRQNQTDRITSEYSTTIDHMMEEDDPEWDGPPPSLDNLETSVEELRTKLEAMGPVNLIAIDEYKELEERYAFLMAQEDDLQKSKFQLMEMIRKINRTTSEMFRSTFEEVNTNFQTMFTKLFNGGSAKLVLVNEEDVLECGIEIIARPPGKRLQNVSLLSGGERTMTAVALLFAIYMRKPSPFCLLDELDAALDDSNIGRFVFVLKEFLAHSQFVIITHNRQTIAAASTLYGVTMAEKGISDIVSMKFSESKQEPEPVAAV